MCPCFDSFWPSLWLIDASSFELPSTSKTSINWKRISRGPFRWSGAGPLVLWREVEGTGLIQSWEEMASRGPNKSARTNKEVTKKMEPGFYSNMGGKDKRQWTETETRTVVSKRIQEKTVSPWEQWSSGRGCMERVCCLLAWMFTGSVRIKLWVTSSDLIAELALRRMTCPTWTALWFTLDGGQSLPCSDLPKAV